MRLKKRLIIRLVTERNKGKSSKNLAKELGISKRRVNQVYAKYLKDGVLPVIGNGVGRPMKPVQDWETEVVREAHTQQRVGARRLEKVIEQDYRTFMGHNRIHKILLQEGLAKPNKNKQKRRKYRCYEREHSLSAVHLDWHPTKDGKHVLAVIDDASRKILAGGEFDAESVETTLAMSLQVIESVQDFACIREFITDNGSVFTCNLEGERVCGRLPRCFCGGWLPNTCLG
ncbi:hypothetical protein HZC09_04395 [Candidatus Micrarchaeota archaeon]|nr:hypothetical protein [Candidatus Micrarchaeota archaeon]